MKSKIIIAVSAVALVASGVWQSEWDLSWFEIWIRQHRVLGAGRLLPFTLVVIGMVAVVLVVRRLWKAHR